MASPAPVDMSSLEKDAILTITEGAAMKFEALFFKAWVATVGKADRRKDVMVKQVEKWNILKINSNVIHKGVWAEVQRILA